MSKNINVLTIDGGGIRGLMSAQIISYIEEKLQEKTSSDVKIGEYFDLIVGTSTGGILSCIYCFPDKNGRPLYSSQDAVDLYLKNGGFIFSNNFWYKVKTFFGLSKSKYDGKNLNKMIKSYIGGGKISESTTNMMITSVDPISNELFLFKSHKAKTDMNRNFTFEDAAISTSAAPIYLPPHKIGDKVLVDGGMSINNPSMSGYVEAIKMFPESKRVNILSIGTGTKINKFDYEDIKNWGIYGWLINIGRDKGSPLVDLILNASSNGTEYLTEKLYDKKLDGYHLRIDPIINENVEFSMDKADDKNLKEMSKSSRDTIEHYKKEIDEFIEKTLL